MEFQTQHNQNNVGYQHLSSQNVDYQHKNIFVSETLGGKIRQARKQNGLSLKDLGARIGRSHATLSQIENDKHDTEKATLIALAKELNDGFGEEWLNEFLNGNDSAPNKSEIVRDMTAEEFISLKFPEKKKRRSKTELDMLTKMMDAEIEKMKRDKEKYGE